MTAQPAVAPSAASPASTNTWPSMKAHGSVVYVARLSAVPITAAGENQLSAQAVKVREDDRFADAAFSELLSDIAGFFTIDGDHTNGRIRFINFI
jgi:hypothetical protein